MAELRLFELDDALESGQKARAKLLAWNGSQYTTVQSKTIIVHSFAGAHGVPGDRGYCFLGDSNCWEVVGNLINLSSLG